MWGEQQLRCKALDDVKKTPCAGMIFTGRVTSKWNHQQSKADGPVFAKGLPNSCSVWFLSRDKYVKTWWATNACYSQLEMHSHLGMSCALFCLPFCYCFVFIVFFETGTYYVDLGWPPTHRNLSASISKVLGLNTCANACPFFFFSFEMLHAAHTGPKLNS